MGCYCEYGGDGAVPEFYTSRDVRARKTYRCVECTSDILPGEVYNNYSGKWDGEMKTYRTCMSCKELRDMWEKSPNFDNWTFGQVGCWYSGVLEDIAEKMDMA